MKKCYLSPNLRIKDLQMEFSFLDSTVGIGGSTGEDLDDSGVVINPWS